MKKIFLATAFVTVIASPSFAATMHHHRAAADQLAAKAYAMAPARNVVVDDGQVLGADPDPFIRASLIREGDPANYAD